jgi:hypothetical protein
VLVAGASGVGKSTFAAALAARWGLRYTEIDSLHWGDGWMSRPTFAADAAHVAAGDRWVAEFQYREIREMFAERAELLIHLDYARPVVVWRIVRRTVRRRISRAPMWDTDNIEPPLHTVLTNPEHIIRFSWNGIARYRSLVAETASDHPHLRVIRLRSPRATRRWLESTPTVERQDSAGN